MADLEDDGPADLNCQDEEEEEEEWEEKGEEDNDSVLDLNNKHLTSLDNGGTSSLNPKTLIIDNNDLVRLDGIEKYGGLEQLSASNNRIVRTQGLNLLSNLSVLCLSSNSIVVIEDISELCHLVWLDLSSNSIKVIERLPKAGNLYYIDLSDNEITAIADISRLKQLKTLLLHGNNISTLKQVPSCLPQSLSILSLADNGVYDLNEICYLASLPELQQLSLSENPCLMMTGDNQGYDYRPFVWNWCPSVAVLDGFVVSEKERLLGEWLYSQGKGRHFHPGQHAQLVEYLSVNCSLTSSEQLRTEEESHLSQVLSQQRRYRQQLQQQQHGYQYHHHHNPQQQASHLLTSGRSDMVSSPRLGDSMKNSASEANTLEQDLGSPSVHHAPTQVNQGHPGEGQGQQAHSRQYWADHSTRLHAGDRQVLTDDRLALQEISHDDAKSNESLLDSESVYLPFDVPASPIIQRRPFTAPEKRSQAFHKSPHNANATLTIATGKPPTAGHHGNVNTRPATAIDTHHGRYSSVEHRPIKPFNQNINKIGHRPNFEISPPVTSHSEPSVSHISDTQLSTACSQDYDSSSEPLSESEPVPKPTDYHASHVQNGENWNFGSELINTPQTPPKDKLNLIKSVIGSKKSTQTSGSTFTEKSKAATHVKSVAFSMKTSLTNKSSTTTTAPTMAAAALSRARISKGNSQQPDKNANEQADNASIESGAKVSSVELRAKKKEPGDNKHIKGRLNLEKMELRKDGGLFGSVRDSGFLSRPSSDAVEDVQVLDPDHKAATTIQAYWRGYWAREFNSKVISVRKEIRARRAEDHIMLLRKDLERNQKLYEEEKRLRVLQMEAIRILYQEVQVLKSQTLNSTNDFNRSAGHVDNSNSLATTNLSTATTCSELNRTQELERTCVGLQRQVSQLQETLESVSSAVFRSNSLDGTSFDLTDNSQTVQVVPYGSDSPESAVHTGESSRWGPIPHSLSPYPSEEEELYYLQFPSYGAPTPPRRLQLYHHGRNSLILSWQPSSCPGSNSEVEGNKHIIGYRVYVNDQLQAFICQRTSAVVNGLSPVSTYKFYVKALSGFGESYESNIIMAKLAKGNERHKYSGSSGSDSSGDSDKDIDSTENVERQRHRNRKPRKSPRSVGEKKKSSRPSHSRHVEFLEGLSELQEGSSSGFNQNNSAFAHSPILMHPKLHTHRRNRSRDLQYSGDSLVDASSKSMSSPGAGGMSSASGEVSASPLPSPQPPAHHREGTRRLPESPLAGSGKERVLITDAKDKPLSKEAVNESKSRNSSTGDNPYGPASKDLNSKKDSSPVGSSKHQSSPSRVRKEEVAMAEMSKTSSGGSANVSPACGSEGEQKLRISPKSNKEIIQSKLSPPCGSIPAERSNSSQSSSMSETFTIDKAHSFLESDSTVRENTLGPRFVGGRHDRSHRNSPSTNRGHRRTKSRDYQLMAEKSRSTPELTGVELERRHSDESQPDPLSLVEAQRLGIGRVHAMDSREDVRETTQNEIEASINTANKVRGHRRKRSKDLNHEMADIRKEDNADLNPDGRGEEQKADQHRVRDLNAGRCEDDSAPSSIPHGGKEAAHSQAGRPVLDGRRRHSSGSGPSSPVIMAGEKQSSEDKTRMSVAEQLEQRYKSLKSSSLNSLSGQSEEGRGQDIDRRTPSSESLPATSFKGDSSKRTASNESLLSGGSSRGESSKRTHSSESLMSIRTDTSKRSQSNESLPGSARTDPSRRSPSNESLPESIREENEMEDEIPTHGCRRSQSMGSARDIALSLAGGESSSSTTAKRSSRSVMSKFLLTLESKTRNNSSSVKETKKSLIKRSNNDDSGEATRSKPPSDDEKKTGRRSRNLSESDAEGGTSDPGSQLPPRAPSESSSGSHSDDNRHSRRTHQRTPSDHRQPSSLPMETDPTRPTHSPIIMEGAMLKKQGSNVRRNQSFHGLLPSKHQDAKASPSSNEDISSSKTDEQNTTPPQAEVPTRTRSHLRSRTPSPASGRQPILSVAQLKRHSDSGAKLRNRSRDLQYSGDSLVDASSKSMSSPGAGGMSSASGEVSASPLPSPQPPAHHREGTRRLPESPLAGSGKERVLITDAKDKPLSKEAVNESKSRNSSTGDNPYGPASKDLNSKKDSSPVGSSKHQSSPSRVRKEEVAMAEMSKTSSGGSANVSPACGSEGEQKLRISPKSNKEIIQSKLSPPCGSIPAERSNSSQSSSMSETFTIDKAHSFLESDSTVRENTLGPRFVGGRHDRSHRNSPSTNRGHRRTKSRDYQLMAEKSRSTPELTGVELERRHSDESQPDPLSLVEAQRLGIGRVHAMDSREDVRETTQNEIEASINTANKVRGHRRKRSKDLNHEMADIRKEDNADLNPDGRGEEQKADQHRVRDLNAGRCEDDSAPSSIPHGGKEAAHSQAGRPVLDGRRRHSSGSGPSSPVIMAGEKQSSEDKTRMSVAEQLEQRYKSLKSSSLNSLSGQSEEGRGQDIDRRTPSSESLPATSFKGDSSKRTASNESLLSGGSSRGESSKRTHSSESLMSIRTDTSKRSQSNESLPGSARTDPSRRSPSNESLPESIREENEMEDEIPTHGCRRSQSMGSARDIALSLAGGESSSSTTAKRSSRSVMSKFLLTLESKTRNNSSSVKETKKSLIKRSNNDDSGEATRSKPPSDDEKKTGRRSRNLSESDAEGGTSDPGSQLPPRAPSESSSGSHSDDNRHSRRTHQRTPSDHRQPSSLPMETDPTRPTHSPIIMEGAMLKKQGSNVRRNQSFHGLLPSKHQDAKASPSSNEDISSSKTDEQNTTPPQAEVPTRTRSHLRSRTPSPASGRQPILSVAQLKRHSDSGAKLSMDSTSGKFST